MANIDYKNPYGIWQVTTERDEEGNRIQNLGTYCGRLDEIAFALSDKVGYTLKFSKVDMSVPRPAKVRNSVSIVLDCESGTWNMTPTERAAFVRNMLGDTDNIHVEEGQYYASVRLCRDDPTEAIRAAALAKLTPEEKAALGLIS